MFQLRFIALVLITLGPLITWQTFDKSLPTISIFTVGMVLWAWGMTVAGFGVWRLKPAAHYQYLLLSSLAIGVSFDQFLQTPTWTYHSQLVGMTTGMGVLAYVLHRNLFSPWLNPRLNTKTVLPRFLLRAPSELEIEGLRRPSEVLDISEGGCFLRSDTRLIMGEDVGLNLKIQSQEFRVRAKVQWIREEPRGYGLRFTELTRKDAKRLRSIIETLPSKEENLISA